MHTNFLQSTEYTEETECLADIGHGSEEFVDNMLFLSRKNQEGLRLLGGSSRFAQVETTSCGSFESMVCQFRLVSVCSEVSMCFAQMKLMHWNLEL